MIRTLLATAAILSPLPMQCGAPTPPPPPAERPPCQGEVVLRQSWDALDNLSCDVNPPQSLAVRIDEISSDYDRCHDHGGQILYDDEEYAIYCINLDY